MDDRVVKIVQDVLENTPVYFGDSSITIAKFIALASIIKIINQRLDPKAYWNSKSRFKNRFIYRTTKKQWRNNIRKI